MGYTTDFSGCFNTNKPVENWFMNYINRFNDTRHMQRDVEEIKRSYPNWKDLCFKGNLGKDGEYFIGGEGNILTNFDDHSIVNYNYPGNCPGLWCQWQMDDNETISWDECEKFYEYIDWLEYLIENFFKPEGYIVNGSVEWQGEDADDFGTIEVIDNVVKTKYGIRLLSMSDLETDEMITELESRGYKVTKN